MIHAYLHVTQGLNYRDSHGPEFRSHLKRINAQEGSKITIFHNFRKEVDKYRIHVYRCDGPCVSRRPFYGLLRRAIERPPGPTDKWWAKHELECGGTFNKIEGPGAITPTNSFNKTEGPGVVTSTNRGNNVKMISPTDRKNMAHDSNKRLGSEDHKEDIMSFGVKKRISRVKSKDGFSNKRNHQSSNNSKGRENNDENIILKRIKDKYADVKQTILLSKEDSKHLSKSHHQASKYPHPCPFGNYVEGKINYNYRVHSPGQIKISKYLNRYQEALGVNGPSISNTSKRKSIDDTSCSKTSKFVNALKEDSEHLSKSHQRTSKYPHPCPIGNYVEGKINYDYRVHSPGQIKISKYLNKYREAVGGDGPSISNTSKKKSTDKSLYSKKSKCVSQGRDDDGTKVNVNYNYQAKTPDQIKLAKYLNRHREAEYSGKWDSKPCPASTLLYTNSIQSTPAKAGKLRVDQDMSSYPGSSKTTLCPVCSIRITNREYEQHLGECFGNDLDFDIDIPGTSEAVVKKSSGYKKTDSKGNYWDEFSMAKNCLNCGSKVLAAEMKLHLQYCTDSDDDTDSLDSPQKQPSSQTTKDDWKFDVGNTVDDSLVSCPSCMEKVKEQNIQEHLDECLKFIAEEF